MSLKRARDKGEGFINYILTGGRVWKTALVVAVALIFILLGSSEDGGGAKSEMTEEQAIEQRLAELCSSLEGVGKCKVMVYLEKTSTGYGSKGVTRVVSVTVLCRGARSESVRKNLTDMICSMYGIGSNRVMVGHLG